jgi:hypothetical protein
MMHTGQQRSERQIRIGIRPGDAMLEMAFGPGLAASK